VSGCFPGKVVVSFSRSFSDGIKYRRYFGQRVFSLGEYRHLLKMINIGSTLDIIRKDASKRMNLP
jgi:hypothetical protein